jgi:hypothetical protein
VAAIISTVIAVSVYPTDPPTASAPPNASSLAPPTAIPLMIPTNAPVAYPSAPWIWEQQGQSIVGDAENDKFGHSMAMSTDAKTVVIGATGSNSFIT